MSENILRLTELEPRWIGLNLDGESARFGVSFRCPHCKERLAVLFKPFIDLHGVTEKMMWAVPGAPNPNTGMISEPKWWHRTGETFDVITLTPSINAEEHWHGFITHGIVK